MSASMHQPKIHLVLTVLTLVCLVSCTGTYKISAEPISGYAIDSETGQPIPDAYAVVIWNDYHPGHTSWFECLNIGVDVTDDDGYYSISGWEKYRDSSETNFFTLLGRKEADTTSIYLHKRGYQWPGQEFHIYQTETLQQTNMSPDERLRYLRHITNSMDCDYLHFDFENALVPVYRSIVEEARSLAVSSDDKKLALSLQARLERLEIGFEKAEELYKERIKCLDKESACLANKKQLEAREDRLIEAMKMGRMDHYNPAGTIPYRMWMQIKAGTRPSLNMNCEPCDPYK